MHAGTRNFQPLFSFLATDVVFVENRRRLNLLPPQSRGGILSVVAMFMPFYNNIMVSFASVCHPSDTGLLDGTTKMHAL